MFVSSKTPRQLAVSDENGVHRPRRASLLDAEESKVELPSGMPVVGNRCSS